MLKQKRLAPLSLAKLSEAVGCENEIFKNTEFCIGSFPSCLTEETIYDNGINLYTLDDDRVAWVLYQKPLYELVSILVALDYIIDDNMLNQFMH